MNQPVAVAESPALMVAARDVGKVVRFGTESLTILEGVSVNISAGERVAVVGASGSGKSTLLGILAGLDLPTSGTVELAGFHLGDLDEEARARVRAHHVGFVFQNFQLLSALTALENVMVPLELRGDDDARDQAEAVLTRVGLEQRLGHYPRQLSGGEQQRVAIARAFASRPDVLFADEPTGNLDAHTGAVVAEMLFDLNAAYGATLVLVTHSAELARRCSRVVQVVAGRLASGTVP